MKLFLKNHGFYFLLFSILILSFLIRVVNLSKWPVFADEAIYIRWAQVMKNEVTLRFLPLSDGKQPLFMWLIIPFLKIFHDPLFAGRFLSVLSGTASILAIFLISFFLFKDQKIAIFASFLACLSPFLVFFDRKALVDSLLSFFGLYLFLFSFLAFSRKRFDFALLAGFSLGGALLTKSPALFFSLLLPSFLVFFDFKENKKISLRLVFLSLFYLSTIYVIGYLFYNILRLGPNFHLLSSRNMDYVFPLSHILKDPLNPFLSHIRDIFLWFFYFGNIFVFPLFLLGILLGAKRYRKQTLVLLIWFLFPIFAQAEYARVFTARYILFTVPFFLIILSLSLKLANRYKFIFWFSFVAFVVFSLFQNFQFAFSPNKSLLPRNERSGYLEEWTAGTGIKEVSEYLLDFYSKEQKEILVGTEGYFGTLPDGLQIYLDKYPQIKVVGMGIDFKSVPDGLIVSAKSGIPTFFVVNSSRSKIENLEQLELLAEYRKTERKDGSFEKLLFYKVKGN